MLRSGWGKWFICALVLVLIAGASVMTLGSLLQPKKLLSINGHTVHARIAQTDEQRQHGLSNTSPLGEDEGMLFIFDVPGRWGMWMKDMNYSLDMLWLDDSKQIVHIAEDVSPETYPKVFLPSKDSTYVIELPAGYVEANQVAEGQTVAFTD